MRIVHIIKDNVIYFITERLS